MGFRNSEEIASELSKASMFVLPTFVDNSPNSLLEAMAVGVPCITTKVGGIPTLIENYIDGILIEPGNANILGEKIKELFENKQLSKKLSINSSTKIYRNNHPKSVADITYQTYIEVLKKVKI